MAALCVTTSIALGMSMLPVTAQPGPGSRGAWGPGSMMGPGMMGTGAMWGRGMCSPRAAGLAEWRLMRIEQRVKPNDEQRAKLNELREASGKAAKVISTACPTEIPASSASRLELMEKRLNSMVEAIKIVRPAFEGFYNSLSKEQRALLDTVGPREWGWQHWR
jgi:hypothetical protein